MLHHSDTVNKSILSFWGKSDPALKFAKPALHHMLDVAAVAEQLILLRPQMARRLARQAGLSQKRLASLVAFLAGLHDLGKISLPFQFQCKNPLHWPTEILGGLGGLQILSGPNHWECTAGLLQKESTVEILKTYFPIMNDFTQLVALVAGHHGRAPSSVILQEQLSKKIVPPACTKAATEIANFFAEKFISEPILELNETSLARTSFALNGLITVADWVGSDTTYFPFPEEKPKIEGLEKYWKYAQGQAKLALMQKGLAGATPVNHQSYSSLQLPCVGNLRPMQSAMEGVDVTGNPQLFIIEDTTGSGKTESALLLAGRLMAKGCAEGIYLALPTMATANAMHGRLSDIYSNFYSSGDNEPSIVLAHGKAKLARKLTELRQSTQNQDAESTNAYCAAFIADSRKLALFADIGIGTIDQAFLGVLRKRHLTLRQFALSNRVLIVDEAHAFDAYMGEELKTLLRVQAMNGGSAIVLSATLPQAKRREFAQAFVNGLPPSRQVGSGYAAQYASEIIELKSQSYPLLTRVAAPGAEEIEVAFDQRLARTIKVQPVVTRDATIALALEAASQGAAVVIICNAVDEAIAVYNRLATARENTEKLMLFHARFTVGDRMNIEKKVLELFGKDSIEEKRRGNILVATQVVEQSLDLDFDLVISDLAPIDLLIQRAGRLWRHMTLRPQQTRPMREPVLAVLTPDPSVVKDAKWLEETLGKAAFVYKDPALMWRTAKVLTKQGSIRIPEDLRPMIEHVYQEEADDMPPVFLARFNEAKGEAYKGQSLAGFNVIDVAGGYATCQNLGQDENIGTRDGEPSLTLRLARQVGVFLMPFNEEDGADERLDWELSEIAVPKSWTEEVKASQASGPVLTALLNTWPEFEQDIAVVIIGTNGTAGHLSYSQKFGLAKKQQN